MNSPLLLYNASPVTPPESFAFDSVPINIRPGIA